MRTDFIAPCCIVPNRNLQGLPKHLNGHPKVSEQNLLPQNMLWCTREASRAPGTPLWKDHGFDQTLHHSGEGGGFPPTRPHTTAGRWRGIPTHKTPHHRGRRRERDSHPPDPTKEEEGRGIPTHKTPHHREGRREGDSQSTPPQPTPQKGSFPDLGGVGGAAERVTIYDIYIYIYRGVYVICA